MSTMTINDTWRIRGDEHQWTVEKWGKCSEKSRGAARRAGDGQIGRWVGVSYHQSIEAATASLRRRVARTCDAESLDGIRDALAGLDAEIAAAGV